MCARQSGHVSHRVDVSLRVQTTLTRACAVLCAHFLASFLHFRCLNVTTLFNIDVKNTFSCRRCQLLCCYSACAFAVANLSACNTCSRYFSLHFFYVTVQFRHTTTELCNFDAKQSTLCCFDGFRTLYCCVNADVSFRNYYHSNLSRLFSKASVTVILLRFD